MKSIFNRFLLILFFGSISNYIFAQGACGFGPGKGCPGTQYDNAFVNSDNNAATIEYDNFVSTFVIYNHSVTSLNQFYYIK